MTRIEKHQSQPLPHDVQPEALASARKPEHKPIRPSDLPPCPGHEKLVHGKLDHQKSSVDFARNQASYAGVKHTLGKDPSQADRLISERLRGSTATDRAIVMRAVAERGNAGLRRYADAENALRALQPFTQDERGDILGIMKAGARFESAVQQERAELSRPGKAEPTAVRASTADFKARALANVRAQAAKVNELGVSVTRLSHEIGKLDRKAEIAAGAGAAAGLVGATVVAAVQSVARRDVKPLKDVDERADAAGGLMLGALSRKIAEANQTTARFFEAGSAFTDAKNAFERAVHDGDHAGMVEQANKMGASAELMKHHARTLAAQAQSIAKWNAKFEHAALDMAVHVVLSGAMVGHEFKHLLHPPASALGAVAKEGFAGWGAMRSVEVVQDARGKEAH